MVLCIASRFFARTRLTALANVYFLRFKLNRNTAAVGALNKKKSFKALYSISSTESRYDRWYDRYSFISHHTWDMFKASTIFAGIFRHFFSGTDVRTSWQTPHSRWGTGSARRWMSLVGNIPGNSNPRNCWRHEIGRAHVWTPVTS